MLNMKLTVLLWLLSAIRVFNFVVFVFHFGHYRRANRITSRERSRDGWHSRGNAEFVLT